MTDVDRGQGCSKHEKALLAGVSMYVDQAKKKNRKWWHTMREDRSRDIENETMSTKSA